MTIWKPWSVALVTGLALASCNNGDAAMPAASGSGEQGPAATDRGSRVFLRCQSCHTIGGGNNIGPDLKGVVGSMAAQHQPTYTYSTALAASQLRWDAVTLDRWLENPAKLVPGTKMAFVGLSDPADRKAVIEFLLKSARK